MNITEEDKKNTQGITEKRFVINLCRKSGIVEINSNNSTFASMNKDVPYYPSNVNKRKLKKDWFLILKDWNASELIILKIPAYSINEKEVVFRTDKSRSNYFRFYIKINDENYTEYFSKLSLKQYCIKTISYKSYLLN